jgi:hypothetical protein
MRCGCITFTSHRIEEKFPTKWQWKCHLVQKDHLKSLFKVWSTLVFFTFIPQIVLHRPLTSYRYHGVHFGSLKMKVLSLFNNTFIHKFRFCSYLTPWIQVNILWSVDSEITNSIWRSHDLANVESPCNTNDLKISWFITLRGRKVARALWILPLTHYCDLIANQTCLILDV